MNKLIYKEETYQIQGAVFEVYKKMGAGFLEAVYQECLAIEFSKRKIPYEAEKDLNLIYDNIPLSQKYRVDFLCYEKVLIELKAAKELTETHSAQVINYLKATGLHLALLVNFGSYPQVTIKRFAH